MSPFLYQSVLPGGFDCDKHVSVREPRPSSSSEEVCRSILTLGLSKNKFISMKLAQTQHLHSKIE